MKVVGLIVEYNPLHNGHLYHYQESLRTTGAEASVAVMSGNFLQRGEPAIVNKWARAQMALDIGIDLVLELPTVYCTQNAETFAYGAVSTLDALGVVQQVCFGSESGDLSWLLELAAQLEDEPVSFKEALKAQLTLGLPYPKAYARAAASLVGVPEELLNRPNNILGLNYVLALKRLGSSIQPATITRQKAGYHQADITDQKIASATALRKLIFEQNLEAIGPYVPQATLEILQHEKDQHRFPMSWDQFYSFLSHSLTVHSAESLSHIHEMEEGIEHRIKKLHSSASHFQELMEILKTKRYTWNRIQRLLLYILLNLHKKEIEQLTKGKTPSYIRVLGFNEKGRQLLHMAKKKATVPIIATVAGKEEWPMLGLDLRAASVYCLGYPGKHPKEREFTRIPLMKA
ncbi:nucleotidyltransferase [Ammoniphilus sp. YIM 78166]|uniref:nucleotidyltransferase n=1 Tax=Ammoniphilus sp. YIM 78166 TaxID=1644106 RepID=UPI0010703F34|nr:nucleotidyltransferase [Ammoniphilus sp. YIM 78166]